ncbi:MAG TPA: ABC transporter ATP-binding protein [Actinomycetota bacterium]|nr:ABC transporter ATP-binding protein [Actinomycetota bacterium]
MIGVGFHDVRVRLDGHEIIRGVNLDVPARSWVGIIGPNGAGKTTLVRGLLGAALVGGTITIGDRKVSDLDRRGLARLIAYVPQLPYIPRAMSVVDYTLMGRTPYISYLGVETTEDLRVVEEVLERLDLLPFAGRSLGSLSGGELQRVVLARALAQRAPLLVLDEPTSALDVGHQQQVLELVDSLRREQDLTVISAMHDLTLAGQFAERLVLLRDGQIVAEGTAEEVLTEATIATHYGASVKVFRDNGTLVVVPMRERARVTGAL